MATKYKIDEISGDVIVLCNNPGCPTEGAGMTTMVKKKGINYHCPACNNNVVIGFKNRTKLLCPVCQNTLCECNKGKKILVGNDIVIPGFTIPLFTYNVPDIEG